MLNVAAPETKEISLHYLASLVRGGWRSLLLSASIGFALALIGLLVIQPRYTIAMAVAAIPQQNGADGLSSLGGGAGLTSILHVGQTDKEFLRYQTALTTVELGRRLMTHHDLIENAFPGAWDPGRHAYHPKKRLLGPIYALFGAPTSSTYSGVTVADYLASNLKISQPDDQPDVVSISMTSPHPEFARALLLAVHQEATEMLRVEAAQRADRMIGYLRGRLETLTVQDYRQSLLLLMGQQENLRLLSEPGVAYAAEILDPPHASDLPTFPKPIPFIAIGIVLGLAIGFVAIVLLDAFGISTSHPLRAVFRYAPKGLIRRGGWQPETR